MVSIGPYSKSQDYTHMYEKDDIHVISIKNNNSENKDFTILNYIENYLAQLISDTPNDSFRTEMIADIKRIQLELNELKTIKKNIVKKSSKRKITAKRKPSRKVSKPKRKIMGVDRQYLSQII